MEKRYDFNTINIDVQSVNYTPLNGKLFTVILPPPNVTGSLHIGHALNSTLQDIIVRYHKMLGYDVLWQPGTDHAGIATQMLVEKDLNSKGISKESLGREEFISKVWEWKNSTNTQILDQLSKLGCICNWDRVRFTMDEGSSEAVLEAFIKLYNDGLIYKAKRLVNWDCKLKTAISDLEVNSKEVDGKLFYIKYPLIHKNDISFYQENFDWNSIGDIDYAIVATTRPETMFGDVAIAINPNDNRVEKLKNYLALIPETNRFIPIIEDSYVDQDYGSGLVKITPGHDFNDYEVGQRHSLEAINILNSDGTLNSEVPDKYSGMDRISAREVLINNLESLNLIDKIENIKHAVPYGDRSGSVIEPLLTDQWIMNVKPLAEKAISAVEDKSIQFIPNNWTKNYLDWMNNIQPWCISRQLWWGHRIPVWYDEMGNYYAAKNIEDAKKAAYKKLNIKEEDIVLNQETDVLDTWFSSALWPMTTLNWPQRSDEISKRYPTDVLFTGFDIIFFWVARMIMMGLHFQNDVPFKNIYIHGLICDEHGQKMSKSKGNVINPMDIMSKYGADALRFALTMSASHSKEISFSENKVDSAHKFITKIWNLVRFADLNGCFNSDVVDSDFNPENLSLGVNKWIVEKFSEFIADQNKAIDLYRFNDFASNSYHFIWDSLCDWYVELAKFYLKSEANQKETRPVMYWVIKRSLLVLHPIMPEVTSYLLKFISDKSKNNAPIEWPIINYKSSSKEIENLISIIQKIRSIKSYFASGINTKCTLVINSNGKWAECYWDILSSLCKLESYCLAEENKAYYGIGISDSFILLFNASLDEEISKLKKDLSNYLSHKERVQNLLSDDNFTKNAPEIIIQAQRDKLVELQRVIDDLNNFISCLIK